MAGHLKYGRQASKKLTFVTKIREMWAYMFLRKWQMKKEVIFQKCGSSEQNVDNNNISQKNIHTKPCVSYVQNLFKKWYRSRRYKVRIK